MLVTSTAHGLLVKERLQQLWQIKKRRYFCFDTETKSRRGYPSGDALIIGRTDVTFFSICYMGESYSFPTSNFDSKFPDAEVWGELFKDWFIDKKIVKVKHNANYDMNAIHYSMEIPIVHRLWDTMIGAWKASEYKEKGLKERAPAYGRFWRTTKTIDFSNLMQVAEYAEQDVIQTDEMYQMQVYGYVDRPKTVSMVKADGKLMTIKQMLPAGRFKIKDEIVRDYDKEWLKFLELPYLRAAIRAERRGFPIDVVELRKIRKHVNNDLRNSLKTMYKMAGRVVNLGSGKQLSEVCDELGIENPHRTKASKKHPNGQPCWNAKALSKLKGIHPFIDALSTYRGLEKLSSVYIGKQDLDPENYAKSDCGLEYFISPVDGCIHCTQSTVAAVTGRNSASNPNLHQIPSRKDKYGIKNVFSAIPVTVIFKIPKRFRRDALLIVLDYAQLEIRVMCLLSKDKAMAKILSDPNGDIHQNTADEFGVNRDPQAKNLNFLLLYAGGAYMLSETLTFQGVSTSKTECAEYIERHKEVYPRVDEYRKELLEFHQQHGYIKLFTGRRRTLPDIDWEDDRSIHKAETTLSNNVVQGSGQDFLKAAIVRADFSCINPDRELPKRIEMKREHRLYLADKAKKIEKYRKILKLGEVKYRLQVHDEGVFSSHPSAAEEGLHIIADIMSWRHYFPATSNYNVPLVVEGGVGPTWKVAKSKESLYHCKEGFDDWKKYAN